MRGYVFVREMRGLKHESPMMVHCISHGRSTMRSLWHQSKQNLLLDIIVVETVRSISDHDIQTYRKAKSWSLWAPTNPEWVQVGCFLLRPIIALNASIESRLVSRLRVEFCLDMDDWIQPLWGTHSFVTLMRAYWTHIGCLDLIWSHWVGLTITPSMQSFMRNELFSRPQGHGEFMNSHISVEM